jgi:uncharacterized glyoxalase superfamily protein PhnB
MSLDAIGIISADPGKSFAFYALLGLHFEQRGDGEHYEARTPHGLRVMLDSVALIHSFDPEWQKPTGGSGVVLCFAQATPGDVDRLYEKLVAATGARGKKKPWDAFWGHRYACVIDPDGNQVDLFAPLPA